MPPTTPRMAPLELTFRSAAEAGAVKTSATPATPATSAVAILQSIFTAATLIDCFFPTVATITSRCDYIWKGECPLWVKSRHVQCTTACPLYPRKRHQTRHMG